MAPQCPSAILFDWGFLCFACKPPPWTCFKSCHFVLPQSNWAYQYHQSIDSEVGSGISNETPSCQSRSTSCLPSRPGHGPVVSSWDKDHTFSWCTSGVFVSLYNWFKSSLWGGVACVMTIAPYISLEFFCCCYWISFVVFVDVMFISIAIFSSVLIYTCILPCIYNNTTTPVTITTTTT